MRNGCGEQAERGAAAVEFALVLPVLLFLLLGIFEFGRIYNVQISLTNAAREGARYFAIHHSEATAVGDAKDWAVASAPSIPTLTAGEVAVPATCTSGVPVTVTISHNVPLLTGYFSFLPPMDLEGKGAMTCGG